MHTQNQPYTALKYSLTTITHYSATSRQNKTPRIYDIEGVYITVVGSQPQIFF